MRVRRKILASLILALLMFALVAPAFAQEAGDGGKKACTGKGKRACEIPEVPVAAALPAAGLLAVAGYVLVDRRRRTVAADVA